MTRVECKSYLANVPWSAISVVDHGEVGSGITISFDSELGGDVSFEDHSFWMELLQDVVILLYIC